MSAHYSKFDLNTYALTPYFQEHIPEDYPLEKVLQKSRAFRRLPPNLQKLSRLAKQWAIHNWGFPAGILGIEQWYDNEGYELDPGSGKRLTDKEIDAQWQDDSALKKFKVTDIPIPSGGFADPHKWEEPPPEPEEEDEEADKPPDEDKLTADIGSHSREYVAKEYGIPLDFLKNISTDKELAQAIIDMRDGGVGVGLSLEEDISAALAQTATWRKNLPPGARYGKKAPGPGWTMVKGPRGGTIWIPPTPAKVSPTPVPAPATTPPVAPPIQTPPVAKPAPPPVTPPPTAPIPTREFPQRDPNHKVAKAIRADTDSAAVVDKVLSGVLKDNPQLSKDMEDLLIFEEENKKLFDEYFPLAAKYGIYSQEAKTTGDAWTNHTKSYEEVKKRVDTANEKARKSLTAALKPTNPPELEVKEHQGNKDSWKKGFLAGAGIGQGIGGLIAPGIGHAAGAAVGGTVGAITAFLNRTKPIKLSDEQRESVDAGVDFVRSICEWSGTKGSEIIVGESEDGRAYFTESGIKGSRGATVMVGLGKDSPGTTKSMIHELGHMIESLKPGAQEKAVEFLKYRTEGQKPVDLSTISGGLLMKGEKGLPDDFDRSMSPLSAAYVGKSYKSLLGKMKTTEIISMGIENLHTNPAGFMAKDPEYAQFIIGILRSK